MYCVLAPHPPGFLPYSTQGPVVQRKVDNAIHWIKLYLLDSIVGFLNACPQDSDLSVDSERYPRFKLPWPGL